MAQIHNEDIKDLLAYFPVIPEKLLCIYLMKQYDMTLNRAKETIYNACRTSGRNRPVAFVNQDGIARSLDCAMNSEISQRCRAFRVCCEFLPSSRRFVIPKVHPWLLNFHEDGVAYYVCEIHRGEELLAADMIRNRGVAKEMMSCTVRIAVVVRGTNLDLLRDCGIKYFCTIDEDYELEILECVDDEVLWNGVPITE